MPTHTTVPHQMSTATPKCMFMKQHQQNSLEPFFLTCIVGPEEKMYMQDVRTMVNHSEYIHSYLTASLMSGRKDPLTVYFPDIPPSVWDQMMKYLDCCTTNHNQCYLNVFEAASLREWYTRYGFEEGKRACDRALYGPTGAGNC